MLIYFKNIFVYVWLFLTAITLASWWLSKDVTGSLQPDAAVTTGVLVLAAAKAFLVMRYFMEGRFAPGWLKLTLAGWLALVLAAMLAVYFLMR